MRRSASVFPVVRYSMRIMKGRTHSWIREGLASILKSSTVN